MHKKIKKKELKINQLTLWIRILTWKNTVFFLFFYFFYSLIKKGIIYSGEDIKQSHPHSDTNPGKKKSTMLALFLRLSF